MIINIPPQTKVQKVYILGWMYLHELKLYNKEDGISYTKKVFGEISQIVESMSHEEKIETGKLISKLLRL